MKNVVIFGVLFSCVIGFAGAGLPVDPPAGVVNILSIDAAKADFDGNGKTTRAEVIAFVRLNGNRN